METGFHVTSSLVTQFSLSMSIVLSELGNSQFVASWISLSNSGTVKNCLFCSILSDTLVEDWAAFFRIYRRNASLCHLLMMIIVSGDTNTRYIDIEYQ